VLLMLDRLSVNGFAYLARIAETGFVVRRPPASPTNIVAKNWSNDGE
jgi:hypothetical protein